MRIKEAKEIPLTGILRQLGHEPVAQRNNGDLRYLSPFRKECEPSFDVNPQKNIWYDFAVGGGTVIDFALHYFSCMTISDALKELERFQGVRSVNTTPLPLFPHETSLPTAIPSPPTSVEPSDTASGITIKKVQPLQNKALIQYLAKRAIQVQYARPYMQEAYYTVKGRDRTYFAVAFPNMSGSYELRNPHFQGVAGSKDISLIFPSSGESSTVTVFEGFLDFISALLYWKMSEPEGSALILNSVAMKDRAIAVMRKHGFTEVQLYLDRDESGRRLTKEFLALEGMAVADNSSIFEGYKDFNAFLQGQRQQERM